MKLLRRLARRVEELEGLDRLAGPVAAWADRVTGPDPVKNALSGTWLGHPLHPMLTDLPIGAWVMAGTLDLTGGRPAARAARRLVGLGVLAAVPAAAAGASDWAGTYGADQRTGLVHAAGNLTAVALQAGSYAARRRGRRGTGTALSAAALGVMAGAAYLGGHLSFNRGVGVSHTAFEHRPAEWTDVALLPALAPGTPVRVSAGGVPVVLVRHGDQVHALSATCVHAGGPLDEGQLTGQGLRCPWHGSTFALSDGSVTRGPAATSQPRWQVQITGQKVQVRAG